MTTTVAEYFWPGLAVAATTIIECAYIPQLLRLLRLKEANAISLFFPMLSVAGRLLAIGYMAHKGENIFAVGICIGVLLRGMFLAQVGYYKWRQWWARRLREQTVEI
ncbi:MAG: hypothetical protein HZA91_12965 [Verrucomicrobia bacterium]|nr:hypothetical protein [Verrucomicrobiota bacterium]